MVHRILLDFTTTQSINNGLGQYSIHLGNELIKIKPDHLEIHVLVPRGKAFLFPHADGYRYKNNLFRNTTPQWFKSLYAHQWKYDLWHLTNQNSGFLPLDAQTPTLLTIHDINFLREKAEDSWPKRLKKVQVRINRAQVLNAISYYVKDEVNQFLKTDQKPFHVIYNGGLGDDTIQGPDSKPEGLDETPFFFSIGEFLAKKNFHVLIEMMIHCSGFNLYIAGKTETEYGKAFQSEVEQRGLTGQVKQLGHISNEERHWLYRHMTAFVFPSLTEGFGLPIIEAMAYKKPVFCSNRTSLPEIGGDFPFYWENFEAKAMARLVQSGLKAIESNPNHLEQAAQHAMSFNWTRAAQEYMKLYQSILFQKKGLNAQTKMASTEQDV